MSLVNRTFQYQGRNFDPSRPGEMKLDLYLSPEKLVYTVISGEGRVACVREYHSASDLGTTSLLESVMLEDKLLKDHFRMVTVFCGNPTFALIPAGLFEETATATYAETLHLGERDNLEIMHAALNFPGSVIVFPVEAALKKKVLSYFPTSRILPLAAASLRSAHDLSEEEGDGMLAHVEGHDLLINAVRSGQLVFSNRFHFREADDIVYYIQLAAQATGFSGTTFTVWLEGDSEPDGTLLRLLKKQLPAARVPAEFFRNRFDPPADRVPAWKYGLFSF